MSSTNRRTLLAGSVAAAGLSAAWVLGPEAAPRQPSKAEAAFARDPVRKLTDAQWKARLSPAAYAVLRQEDTERPGTSPLNGEKRKGTFACAGCALPLFRSEWKYESGTGWPSFYQVIESNVGRKVDHLLVVPRTEYHCARCLGHQGHVFEDGPKPTGLRYCNNGVALKFLPA